MQSVASVALSMKCIREEQGLSKIQAKICAIYLETVSTNPVTSCRALIYKGQTDIMCRQC